MTIIYAIGIIIVGVYILGWALEATLIISTLKFLTPPEERDNAPSTGLLILDSWKWPVHWLTLMTKYIPRSFKEVRNQRDQLWEEYGYSRNLDDKEHA